MTIKNVKFIKHQIQSTKFQINSKFKYLNSKLFWILNIVIYL